jgi:hypothetical protein
MGSVNANARLQGARSRNWAFASLLGQYETMGNNFLIPLSPEMRPGYTTMNQIQSGSLWSNNTRIHQQRTNSRLSHLLEKSHATSLFWNRDATINCAHCVETLKKLKNELQGGG